MTFRRIATAAVAALTLAATGCTKDDTTTTTPPATPTVVATPDTVAASGTTSMVISVTSGVAPVRLETSRGSFTSGSTTLTTTVNTVPGSATLYSCDARVTASCAGPAVVKATGNDGGYNQITVTFTGFEDCDNGVDDNGDGDVDCGDAQCPDNSACSSTGLVCLSGQCNKCTVVGGTVEASAEVTCTDGLDNDCDGKVDCADSDCADATCTRAAGALGVCDSGSCICDKTEAAESTCGDGKDNDCDTFVDCADSDCVGKTCNSATGMQCTGLTPSTCTYCPTGQTAEAPTQCGDGKDNDCDGKIDCYDPDCQPTTVGGTDGKTCNPFGGVCKLTSGVPSCGCASGATYETSCSGGVDDDCDGATDCADDDCQAAASGLTGQVCDPYGRTCTDAGACACPTGDVELCNNTDAGGNPVDDDCDGKANCLDPDCKPTVPGGIGEDCSSPDEYGMACDSTGTCACTGNGGTIEVAELSCDDGFDNDCDFLVDCQDPDCNARTCGPAGALCAAATTSCVCPGGATETSCSDGIDNDCNGKIDCDEPSCAAKACSTVYTAYQCLTGVCSDPSTQYGVKVTPARTRIPADGVATTSVEIAVTYKGAPKPGVAVALALSNASLGTLTPVGPVTTDATGKATVTFKSSGPSGVETISATYTIAVGSTATGSATVALPAIGEIRVAEGGVLYPVMGVKTSGYQEQNQLVAEVLDTEGNAYPDGLAVTFEHRPLGGSTLSDLVAVPSCAVAPCVQSLTQTDGAGLARVRLYSGTVAGVVRVAATSVAGGTTRRFELPSIAIVGAKPNAGHFSIVCGVANVPALAGDTCHVSNIDAPFTCAAFLKDRYNNLLGKATTVSFMSEAGAVGPPAVTPEYEPASAPTSQADLGTAVNIINTLGAKLPKDVLPYPMVVPLPPYAEESVSVPGDACGQTVHNPRDGVATVVAWTEGEEAFFDVDGDGGYDLGEPFIDLPEPFVDYDDDDTHDADEPFIDTDADGAWDDVNGTWDSSTNVWTKTVVVYTGMPAFMRAGGLDYLSRWVEPVDYYGTFPQGTPIATFAISPEYDADTFNDCNGSGMRDNALESFEDKSDPANGVYDPGLDVLNDCDGDGQLDAAPVLEPFIDSNGLAGYEPSSTLATTDSVIVTASDQNLNRLCSDATYAVTKPEAAKFNLEFFGDPSLPDRYGFSFGFQPCNGTSPASCALDCPDVAPVSGQCVMRTRVSGFSYGYAASVLFTGGAPGDVDGSTSAEWDVTLFGETLQITVSGTHQ